MLVLKIVKWGAFAGSAAWLYWGLSQQVDANIAFGLAGAAGCFVLAAFFAALDRIVLLLARISPPAAANSTETSVKSAPIGFFRSLVYGLPLK